MVILAVAVGALLLIVSVLQSTYPENQRVRSRQFKIVTVSLAAASACLMVISAVREAASKKAEEVAQARLRAAMEGLSRTVFPQDMEFEFDGTYSPPPKPTGGFSWAFYINVYVIPKDSPFFCRWGVTHTPALELGLGQAFSDMQEPTSDDLSRLSLAQGVQFLNFQVSAKEGGPTARYARRLRPPTLALNRYLTLEEYVESELLCVVETPGKLQSVTKAELILKGKRVLFDLIPKEGRWVGSTVFRPTWERYCQGR